MPAPVFGSQTSAAIASMIKAEPKGIPELVTKMRSDYQVKLAETTLSSNAKSAKVTVSADSDDASADALAQHLTALWYQTLPAMLDAVAYGRVAFEKVWEYTEGQNRFSKLKPLPYDKTEMLLEEKGADKGAFKGIRLKAAKKEDSIDLTPEYAWWLALDAAPMNPHGTSRFLGAPWRSFQDRQEILKLRGVFVRKFIFQGGIAHTPDTVNIGGENVDALPHLQRAFDELAAGGLFRLPNDRVINSEGQELGYVWDFEKAEFKVNDAQPILQVIDSMDAQQLLAFGIPPKTVIEGDAVGSFALVTQQMLILLSVVEDIVNQILESFQKYVVDPAAEMNGFRNLTANFTPLTNRPDDLASELVKSWLTTPQLSPVLLSGAVDIIAVFEAVGVALSNEAKQRLEAMLQTLMKSQPQQGATTAPTAPALPDASAPAEAPPNLSTDASSALNGAQITAAIDVMLRVKNAELPKVAGLELLMALGIEQARAARMVESITITPGAVNLSPPFLLGSRA